MFECCGVCITLFVTFVGLWMRYLNCCLIVVCLCYWFGVCFLLFALDGCVVTCV